MRTSLSNITRRPGESIQTPLYRLKRLYEMLIQISFPELDQEKVKIRADNYACNVAKFLVSSNTTKVMNEYINIKQQRDERMNLMKICHIITSHEAGNPADRIQQIMSLPASASRLDATISAASNVEELMVAASAFPNENFPLRRVSRHNSPVQHKGRQNRSPFRQQRNSRHTELSFRILTFLAHMAGLKSWTFSP